MVSDFSICYLFFLPFPFFFPPSLFLSFLPFFLSFKNPPKYTNYTVKVDFTFETSIHSAEFDILQAFLLWFFYPYLVIWLLVLQVSVSVRCWSRCSAVNVNRMSCQRKVTGCESRVDSTCRGQHCPRTGSRLDVVQDAVRLAAPPPSLLLSRIWGARRFCWPAWRARSCGTLLFCSETKPGIEEKETGWTMSHHHLPFLLCGCDNHHKLFTEEIKLHKIPKHLPSHSWRVPIGRISSQQLTSSTKFVIKVHQQAWWAASHSLQQWMDSGTIMWLKWNPLFTWIITQVFIEKQLKAPEQKWTLSLDPTCSSSPPCTTFWPLGVVVK